MQNGLALKPLAQAVLPCLFSSNDALTTKTRALRMNAVDGKNKRTGGQRNIFLSSGKRKW